MGRTLGRVAAGIGVPLLTGALALGFGWEGARGALGSGWVALGGFVLPVAVLAVVTFRPGRPRGALTAWAAFPALVGVCLTLMALDHDALAERGVEVTCGVRDVTLQGSDFGIDESEGHPTKTYYVHRLDCPPGGPAELRDGKPLAEKGGKLRLVYDPLGKLKPELPGEIQPWGRTTGALTAFALAALMGVAGRLRGPIWDDDAPRARP